MDLDTTIIFSFVNPCFSFLEIFNFSALHKFIGLLNTFVPSREHGIHTVSCKAIASRYSFAYILEDDDYEILLGATVAHVDKCV